VDEIVRHVTLVALAVMFASGAAISAFAGAVLRRTAGLAMAGAGAAGLVAALAAGSGGAEKAAGAAFALAAAGTIIALALAVRLYEMTGSTSSRAAADVADAAERDRGG
jgi:hypothetical protein